MMNILFDFISTQSFINGGAEYTIRVFDALYQDLAKNNHEAKICALFDRNLYSPYQRFSFDKIRSYYPELSIEFVNDNSLEDIVKKRNISIFFIGIGQRYLNVDFTRLNCRIIMVIHDTFYSEEKEGHFSEYLKMVSQNKQYPVRFIARRLINKLKGAKEVDTKSFFDSINNSEKVEIITVSEYSRNSIIVFGGVKKSIKVLYPPLKLTPIEKDIESDALKDFLRRARNNYLLIVSADRVLKNAKIALKAVEKYRALFDKKMCVLTIGLQEALFEGHYCLPYLSPSDLEHTYKNCYALIFPSMLEGFGLPPLEVMKYGKPVLSSNVCSMPEILGDAPSYFSPFYTSDIVRGIRRVSSNYDYYSQKSFERFQQVGNRQKEDLNRLIKLIIGSSSD